MNYTVYLQLEIILTNSTNSNSAEKGTVEIKVMELDNHRREWEQVGDRLSSLPDRGKWQWFVGGTAKLFDNMGKHVLDLTDFLWGPAPDGQGAIYLDSSVPTNYGPGLQRRGTGKWTMAKNAKQNLPLQETTWHHFIHNMTRMGKLTGWQMVSSRGVSATYGTGKFGGEFMSGGVQIQNLRKPDDPAVWMNYTSAGVGYMMKGAGTTGSTEDFPTWFGAELTSGTIATNEPLELRELEGWCQVVDIGAGYASKYIQLPASIHLPGAGWGGAVSLLMIIFGVPAGLLLGAYKAAGLVVGPSLAYGTDGVSAGATLQVGRISISR